MSRDREPLPAGRRPTRRGARALLLHPVRVVRRLLAEHATPRGLAAAGAFGILVGAFPVIGLHTVIALVGAKLLRLNRLTVLGTNQLCFPPVVPFLCIETGYFMRHGSFLTEVSMRTLWGEAPERFWEWAVGACLVGPVLAAAVGLAIWALAVSLQRAAAPEGPPEDKCGGGEEEAAPAGQP